MKDLLIDALNFSILSVEDRPFRTYQARGNVADKSAESSEKLSDQPSEPKGKLSDRPPRAIEFGDFRTVNGVLVPFSISTKLMGQETLTIHLSSVVFNSNLSSEDFKN